MKILDKPLFLLIFIGMVFPSNAWSQEEEEFIEEEFEEESFELESSGSFSDDFVHTSEDLVKQTEFVIPSSPAFALLNVTPEQVIRPGNIRNLKVDWRIRSYALAPDLAIEAQPIWNIFYQGKRLRRYQQAPKWIKRLSSMSISGATAQLDGINHMAYTARFNLYSKKDPLMDSELIDTLRKESVYLLDSLSRQISALKKKLDTTSTSTTRFALRDSLFSIRREMRQSNLGLKEKLLGIRSSYLSENWNTTVVDFAIGQVFTYDNWALDSANFRSAGWGAWVNAAFGIGKKGLLTGMVKVSEVSDLHNLFLGSSYRFGNSRYNFFLELTYEQRPVSIQRNFDDEELFEDDFTGELNSAFVDFENPDQKGFWNLAYGGDFKINRSILLNYSLRTRLDSKLKFNKFIPVANIICLMR